MPADDVIKLAERFEAALARRDGAALTRLARAYGALYARLQDKIDALALEIEKNEPTRGQLVRDERYRSLIEQVRNELDDYAGYLKTELRQNALDAVGQAGKNARALVGASVGGAAGAEVAAGFNVLPNRAIERLLGFLSPNGPLYARINLMAGFYARQVADKLVEGIGLGYNPRKTAAIIRREIGMGLTDALRMTRTAQIYAYREASRATFILNDDIVDGWYWHATLLSPRTCLSCIRQHGTWHPSTEVLNDHYNGRCAAIPAVKGFSNPIAQTGEEWFNSLSDAKQRELMGERMHDLYKKGAFSFGDLTVEKEDRVYGAMKTRASLEELLAKKA